MSEPTPSRRHRFARPHYRPRTGTESLGGFLGAVGMLVVVLGLTVRPAPEGAHTGATRPALVAVAMFALGAQAAYLALRRSEHRQGGFQAAFLSDAVGTLAFLGILVLTVALRGTIVSRTGPPNQYADLLLIVFVALGIMALRSASLRLLAPGLSRPLAPPRTDA